MDVKKHLLERHLNPDLYTVSWDDETATFALWNLSGQWVGYQQYRPFAPKSFPNDPKQGRYFTWAKNKTAVWGLETWAFKKDVLFVTEGVFDACMEGYVYKQYLKSDKVWDGTLDAVFNLGLHRHIGEYNPYPIYDLSCSMHANKIGCFINYRDGFMPIFHKSMFPYTPPNFFSLGNPFKVLSQYAPTQAFQYMSAIAQVYLQA